MKTTLQILIDARAKIEKPEAWTKGVAARNAAGEETTLEKGSCFCILGAVWAAAGYHSPRADSECALAESLPYPQTTIPKFNDDLSTTHADVLALFDRAIEKAQP